jgi:hypothetical protein
LRRERAENVTVAMRRVTTSFERNINISDEKELNDDDKAAENANVGIDTICFPSCPSCPLIDGFHEGAAYWRRLAQIGTHAVFYDCL